MTSIVTQNLFSNVSATIAVSRYNDGAVNKKHLRPLLETANGILGVAATYGEQCKLSSIAFSTLSHAIVINISARHAVKQSKQGAKPQRMAALIQDRLLRNPQLQKYAFKMDKLAVALFLDLSIYISDGIDMLSVTTNNNRQSLEALMNAMGDEVNLNKENVRSLFFGKPKSSTVNAGTRVALQAWAACRAATLPDMAPRFASLPRIDTSAFLEAHLDALANISRHADRLEALKPTAVKNDVESQFAVKKGTLNLTCDRFSSRIKKSTHQTLQIEVASNGTTKKIVGRARRINGRNAHINVDGPIQGDEILSVTTIGRDNPTCAESTRQDIILKTLQRKTDILSNPFFQALWLPNEQRVWPECEKRTIAISEDFSQLNDSQHVAILRILSDMDDDRIVLVQGPPGTGKTTVIAASIKSHWDAESKQCIWVAAQSNVAVKNIAEKFIDANFYAFRLLVSKDFHYDWHEHLYEKIEQHLIRSDRFDMSAVEAEGALSGCNVVLCTLSMFSNPNISVFLCIVPVQMIILDEASQIECGDYLPILNQFHSTLQKLVFIGDDKQLPPYGQEDIPNLRSVFEFPHIRGRALLLDTQYRMPHVIGNFISENVYDNALLTRETPTTSDACLFIDVNRGQETKLGHSWINSEEARVVINLTRHLCELGGKSFRIITPYDAQRSHIEDLLKREKLTWEDKVFNVDSFQGNEDDYIIVSVVRTNGAGFLRNQRRTNVMLTRCKQRMFICSSRAFLSGNGSETLVGKLAASLKATHWINGDDILYDKVKL